MPDGPWDYDAFLDRFVAWADEREAVRAVVVLRSQARGGHAPDRTSGGNREQRTDRPVDEWSDLDPSASGAGDDCGTGTSANR